MKRLPPGGADGRASSGTRRAQRVVDIANHVGAGRGPAARPRDGRGLPLGAAAGTACTIKAFSAGDRTIARFEEFGADYMLIDGPSPGTGEVFDWRLAEGVVDHAA